jgi:hypothetical protein
MMDTMTGFLLLIIGLIIGNMYAKINILLSEFGFKEAYQKFKDVKQKAKEKAKGVAE